MLTPQEVDGKTFNKVSKFGEAGYVFGLRGYVPEQVDTFVDEVARDYAALYKENAILKSKLKALVEKVEEYHSVDQAMRKALLVAENMANEMIAGAKKQSEELTVSAKQEAERRILDYKARTEQEMAKFNKAKEAASSFINMRIAEYTEEINRLKALRDDNKAYQPPFEATPADNADEHPFETYNPSEEHLGAADTDISEKTVKIENLEDIGLSAKTSANSQPDATEKSDNSHSVFDYFGTAGDKGVSADPNSDEQTDSSLNARVYNINLKNGKTNESFSINGSSDDGVEAKPDKFDNLHFGAAYNNIDE